jgi:hypothetical protein
MYQRCALAAVPAASAGTPLAGMQFRLMEQGCLSWFNYKADCCMLAFAARHRVREGECMDVVL